MEVTPEFPFEEWFKGKKDNDLFTTKEVSRCMRITQRAVRSLIARKRLHGFPVGGVWRVKALDFRNYLVSILKQKRARGE